MMMMDVAAPNEWTQQKVDDGMLNGTMSTSGGVLTAPSPNTAAAAAAAGLSSRTSTAARAAMEMPAPPLQEGGQLAPLRCPRCDSANTKFCYYNNYSLSQPRHFCKACKRYWTRGGTLRNVPVGGGCRKNKRVKKPSSTNAATASSSSSTSSSTDTSNIMPSLPFLSDPSCAAMAAPSASSDQLGLLLYSLANQASVDVSIHLPCNLYDLHQQQVGALGQRFPSSTGEDYYFPAGLNKTTHLPLQTEPAAAATSAPPPLESSLFGSSSTAASLLASTLKQQARQAQQHKAALIGHNPDDYLQLYTGGLYAPVSGGDVPLLIGDIKLEADHANAGMIMGSSRNILEWQMPPPGDQALDQAIASESSLYWNNNMGSTTAAFGASVWPDATSCCGPSIAPLI